MQDRVKIHTSKYAKAYIEVSGVYLIDWPAQSLGLNPIKNLWRIIKLDILLYPIYLSQIQSLEIPSISLFWGVEIALTITLEDYRKWIRITLWLKWSKGRVGKPNTSFTTTLNILWDTSSAYNQKASKTKEHSWSTPSIYGVRPCARTVRLASNDFL